MTRLAAIVLTFWVDGSWPMANEPGCIISFAHSRYCRWADLGDDSLEQGRARPDARSVAGSITRLDHFRGARHMVGEANHASASDSARERMNVAVDERAC